MQYFLYNHTIDFHHNLSNSTTHYYKDDNEDKDNIIVTSNNRSPVGGPLPGIISKSTLGIVLLVNTVVIIFFISLVGSVVNVVNIVVFIKQGLKDPITVTLLVLSITDFGSVFTLWVQSMFMVLHFFPETFKEVDPRYLTGFTAWPHSVFVRVSCLLTVFIALERWICVTFPLRANSIITTRVAKVYNLFVVAFLVYTFIILYCYARVGRMFVPGENRTLFLITLTPSGLKFAIKNSSVITTIYLGTFSLLVIFTVLTVVKLNRQAKWRQSMSTTSGQMEAATLRNQKVVKMVLVICLIFIVSTTPSIASTLAYIFVDGYIEMGRYVNLYSLVSHLCFTLEVANSTANFFIYFNMSTNYSNTLHRLLGRQDTKGETTG